MRKRKVEAGDPDFEAVQKIINQLARTRQKLGYSQADIGITTGYSQSGISQLEAMQTPLVSLLTLIRITDAMGLDFNVVLTEKKGLTQ